MARLSVSVVVAYKDWGAERVMLVARSLLDAVGSEDEVIVSDYGSVAGPVLRERLEALGVRYVYTETDGVWSRSRALNAGFARAKGDVLVATDADMLFTPGALTRVAEQMENQSRTAIVLQCRDLPEGYSEATIDYESIDWDGLFLASRIRPRWGMGGMMAVRRSDYVAIRGFDERMTVYGAEDIDFANRLRRSGVRIHWIESDDVRMYHMWHAPSRQIADSVPETQQAVNKNREILVHDTTTIRNLPSWRFPPEAAAPLVSVVIATRDRADYLGESISSVLYQTFEDFELIVVDDGSTDETRAVVESFSDPRVKYVRVESVGIAAARNAALDISQGKYTAVHDDDDLMLPWRLEASLRAIVEGSSGSTGGWVDFDNQTGARTEYPGKHFSLATILHSSKVYLHPTLLIETDVLRRLRYHESLRSGSDYNLAVRIARSGISLSHTGRHLILRRRHPRQVTERDAGSQRVSAAVTAKPLEMGVTTERIRHMRWLGRTAEVIGIDPEDRRDDVLAKYLPDHLTRRVAVLRGERRVLPVGVERLWSVTIHANGIQETLHYLTDAGWAELAALKSAGYSVGARRLIGDPSAEVVALWALGDTALVHARAGKSLLGSLTAGESRTKTVLDAKLHIVRPNEPLQTLGLFSCESYEDALRMLIEARSSGLCLIQTSGDQHKTPQQVG